MVDTHVSPKRTRNKLQGKLRRRARNGNYSYRLTSSNGARKEFTLQTRNYDEAVRKASELDSIWLAPTKEVALAQMNAMYQYVREHMQDLTLDELRMQLQVSRRIAKALRNGGQIKLSEDLLTILNSNIGFDRRFCLGSRIKWFVGESRDRELYVALNRYLAKVIAEMPESVARVTRGGWATRHFDFLRPLSPWYNQLLCASIAHGAETVVHKSSRALPGVRSSIVCGNWSL